MKNNIRRECTTPPYLAIFHNFLRINKTFAMVFLSCLFILSCGSSETVSSSKNKQEESDYFDNLEERWNKNWQKGAARVSRTMNEMRQVMSGENKTEPVNPQELAQVLPDFFSGLKPVNREAQKTELWGIKISEAVEEFQSGSSHWTIRLSVTDLGSLAGMSSLIRKDWIKNDVNIRTEEGYQKTIKYKNYRALESFNRSKNLLRYEVIINDRFLVEVQGAGTYPHKIREALEQIKWDRLRLLYTENSPSSNDGTVHP